MRDAVTVLGYGIAMSLMAVLMTTFFIAYGRGYEVTVILNRYGEAHAEFAALAVAWPIVTLGFWYATRDG